MVNSRVVSFLSPILVLVVAAARAESTGKLRGLNLFDFEATGGGLNLGGEFPGARGKFAIKSESAHDGENGGRLSFDLTRGNYVAWVQSPSRPLAKGAKEISVWVRLHAAGHQVHCKTRDSTGQEHIRFLPSPPAGQWGRLSFEVNSIGGHWGGANDGEIHWPIVLVQIGVEARGEEKVGHMDMDTLVVKTTAPPDVQPGGSVRLASPKFGNLFAPGEKPVLTLRAHGIEQRPPQRFAGAYSLLDWRGQQVASGTVQPLSVTCDGEVQQQLEANVPGAGAFCLQVNLHNADNPTERLRTQSWFGVLPGPTPRPCRWAGTGIHAGHGWAAGDLRFLDILAATGIGVVREEFGWSGVERQRGQYAVSDEIEAFVNGLAERGIRLNLLLTYGNPIYDNPLDPDAYARWAAWMAKHFEGRVSDFEIWNEPHNFAFRKHYGGELFGNSPWITKFVELTRKAGIAIRSVRKDANVIICAEDVWPTLKQMLEEGIGPAGSVISIHPYCHGQPRPEREVFLHDLCRQLRAVSRKHNGPERVVVTEAGWTTYDGDMEYLQIAGGYPRSSYVHQAQYVIRMFLTSQAAGAEYAIQYDFMNDGDRRNYTEHNFGLVHEDYSPKPSLMAVAAMTRIVGPGRFVADVAPDPRKARAYVFDVNGQPVVAAYAIEDAVEITLKVGVEQLEIADLMGNRRRLLSPAGMIKLKLTETPLYLLGADRQSLLHEMD